MKGALHLQAGKFVEYLKSISNELNASKDRIRLLIGHVHWQTDGENKEAILRKTFVGFCE